MNAFSSIAKLFLIFTWSLLCIFLSLLLYLLCFQEKAVSWVGNRLWPRPMLWILGVTLKVKGTSNIQKGQHYLIMANHASYSDIPVLFCALPLSLYYVAKAELKKIPLLGGYMRMAGMVFIDRQHSRKAKQSIDQAAELVKKGKNVVIFPEGTTSKDGKIAPFKRGGMVLAHAAHSVILPVRIKGTERIWSDGGHLKLKGGRVEVIIGTPIPYAHYREQALADTASQLREQLLAMA